MKKTLLSRALIYHRFRRRSSPTSQHCWTWIINLTFFCQKIWLAVLFSSFFSLSLGGEQQHQSKWPKGAANSQTACVVNLPVICIHFRNADEILLVLNVFEVHAVWAEEMKNTRPKHCVQQLLKKVNFPPFSGEICSDNGGDYTQNGEMGLEECPGYSVSAL